MDIRPIDANALSQHKKMLVERMDGYDIAYAAVPMYKVDELPTLSLNTLRDEIYEDAVAHGLWEKNDGPMRCASKISAETEELSTAAGNVLDVRVDNGDDTELWKEYCEELADVIIMCFSVAGKLGIDIDAAIRRKMEINKGRPWKHGKSNE